MAHTCRVIHRERQSAGKGLLVPLFTHSGGSSLFVHAGECADETSLGIPKIVLEVWARGGSRAGLRPRQQKLSHHLFTFKNSCHGYCLPLMTFIILVGIYIPPLINTSHQHTHSPLHAFLQSFCWFSCSLDK